MCKIQQVQSLAIIERVLPLETCRTCWLGQTMMNIVLIGKRNNAQKTIDVHIETYRDRLLFKCQIGSKMFNPLDLPSACRMQSKKYEV